MGFRDFYLPATHRFTFFNVITRVGFAGEASLTGGLKTYTGIKRDSGICRNDPMAGVIPAHAGISTQK